MARSCILVGQSRETISRIFHEVVWSNPRLAICRPQWYCRTEIAVFYATPSSWIRTNPILTYSFRRIELKANDWMSRDFLETWKEELMVIGSQRHRGCGFSSAFYVRFRRGNAPMNEAVRKQSTSLNILRIYLGIWCLRRLKDWQDLLEMD